MVLKQKEIIYYNTIIVCWRRFKMVNTNGLTNRDLLDIRELFIKANTEQLHAIKTYLTSKIDERIDNSFTDLCTARLNRNEIEM
jgi:hypothetical protein